MTNDAIAELRTLFDSPAADELYDEVVTEREHALQAATIIEADGGDDALITAALLHDVGHLLVERERDQRHQQLGAEYLARWFGPEVCGPVAQHVAAKRYLVTVDADYASTLSNSSTTSLAQQGGPMSPDEVAAFEAEPHFAAAVALRRSDDRAKVPGAPTGTLEQFLTIAGSMVS